MITETATASRTRLGGTLRARREARAWTREQVSGTIGVSVTMLTRAEIGRLVLKPNDLSALLELLQIRGDDLTRCQSWAARGREREWWDDLPLRPTYSHFIGLEAEAVARTDYAQIVLPSPVQTADYAHAVIATAIPELPADIIAARVEARMRRQALLTRAEAPLALTALLDEGCVRREIGGRRVWRKQIGHLLEISAYDNVTIRILPSSSGACLGAVQGHVVTLDFADMSSVAFLEGPRDLHLEGPEALMYKERLSELASTALTPDESRAMIDDLRRTA